MARFSINISSLYSKTLIQKKPYFSFFLFFFQLVSSLCFSFLFVFLFFSLLHLIICLSKERERKSSKRKHFSFFLSLAIASLLWLNISFLMLRWFSFYDFPNGGLVLINYILIGNCWLVTMMLHTGFFFSFLYIFLVSYSTFQLFFSLSLSLEFFCSVFLQFYPFILRMNGLDFAIY